MQKTPIDMDYVRRTLLEMLAIPSPSGLTDEIVHYTAARLEELEIEFELTRRGAIRASVEGETSSPDRAVVAHLDTLGAMVTRLKNSGRLAVTPIGSWSARFAEGTRVTVFTDEQCYRGTILPLLASGHAFGDKVDEQPVAWEQLEVRVDEPVASAADVEALGIRVGDHVAIDPQPEMNPNGFINSRHLDNKAGAAALLGALKAIRDHGLQLPMDFHPLFTLTEEVGSGASAILHGDVSELVSIDIAAVAEGQNAREDSVTIAMHDSSGPFDYHLTRKLIRLCQDHDVPFQRDVFRFYRSDTASAVEAGNDIRIALLCFGADSSHGYERTHCDSLKAVAELVSLYAQSGPTFQRDRKEMGGVEDFPHQIEDVGELPRYVAPDNP